MSTTVLKNLSALKWLLPLCLIASVGGGSFGSTGESNGAISAAGHEHGPADPLSILDGRSPGERGPGALFQTKLLDNLMDAAAMPAAPQSNLMAPSSLPEVPQAFAAIVPPDEMPAAGTPADGGIMLPPVPIGLDANAASRPTVAPFLPVLLPPQTGPILQPAATAPVSGVPEPATWAMLLSGFFTIGCTIRHARRASRPAAGRLRG